MLRKTALFASLIAILATGISLAAEPVKLEIKGTPGRIMKYKMDGGGTLNFVLDGFPIPNSKISGEKLAASADILAYFDTLESDGDVITYNVKAVLDSIKLGGLLQLQDMGGATKAPEINVSLTPQGGIDNIDVHNLKLPGLDAFKGLMPGMDNSGMDMTSLDSMMPMIVGLIPPIFPKDPVAVGAVWTQKTSSENMPLPIFPMFEFKYRLNAIENGVAKIEFKSKGDYDAGFLNNFLSMIPQIPMGKDQMSITHVDLKLTWDLNGTMDFIIDKGQFNSIKADGIVRLDAKGDIMFTHEDGSTTPWVPVITGDMKLNSNIIYVEDMARADYEALFPPAPETEETTDTGVETDGGSF